ncbi:MAG: glycosyltransferase [Patescibacteria group bacterium]|nr:glycosyltransferase [Patescibacteria group bacterium]
MKFSVVVPAYNEAKSIAAAVQALLAQTAPRNEFEIIVVDNNSIDNTFEIARQSGADLVIKETKQGTNMARQAGLAKAKGEIVAFLDADSVPPPDWLEKIEADLGDGKIMAVSGPLDYGFVGIKKFLDLLYEKYFLPKAGIFLKLLFGKKSGVIIGGNFAARRVALDAIGGLPALDFWGDDAAIAMLIARRVGPVLFDSGLIIRSSPRRFERSGFFKLAVRYLISYLKIYFNKKYS